MVFGTNDRLDASRCNRTDWIDPGWREHPFIPDLTWIKDNGLLPRNRPTVWCVIFRFEPNILYGETL
jgi:hypothetical protein